MNKTVEQGISDIVGCLTDPVIVFPGGWGNTIPEWLKTAITLERMMGNMKELKGEEPTGTDAEACAYLMTVSLTQPMDSDWTQIYLYVASQTYKRWEKGEMPTDIAVDSISDYQMGEQAQGLALSAAHQIQEREGQNGAKGEKSGNRSATRGGAAGAVSILVRLVSSENRLWVIHGLFSYL